MQLHALPSPRDDRSVWWQWADERLAGMGLSVAGLHQAAEAGQRREDRASPLAPRSSPGQERWTETVVALRELTGWESDDTDNLPRTVHPSGGWFVVVSTGTSGVGSLEAGACPTPKNGLGTVVKSIIDRKPTTMPMFTRRGEPVAFNADVAMVEPQLWFFLTTFYDGVIYCELSRPLSYKGDEITDYGDRIPLPPFEFRMEDRDEPDVLGGDSEDDGPTDAGPDIDIRPRP